MSTFLSNIFGGNKNKIKKEKPESAQKTNSEEDDNLPVLSRRLSLSKSGRMKEKKRTNVSLVKNEFGGGEKQKPSDKEECIKEERKNSLPSSDIFDVEGIEKAIRQYDQSL